MTIAQFRPSNEIILDSNPDISGGYLVPYNWLADFHYAMGNKEEWWKLVKDDLFRIGNEYQGKMEHRYAVPFPMRWGKFHFVWRIMDWLGTKIRHLVCNDY